MSQFLELQIDIMYKLWVRCHSSSKGFTRVELFEREKQSKNQRIGPVSRKRVDATLDALIMRGHAYEVDLDENAEVMFSITDKGIYWIEDWFRIEENNGAYSFYRRREGPVHLDKTYAAAIAPKPKNNGPKGSNVQEESSHYWTKWGTILTGISILVAIAIAVIF